MQLSDRMKQYESANDFTLDAKLPVIIRLDGKSFHTWTKGCTKPYDVGLQNIFDATTKFLVEQTNAKVGYTQSDEITLILEQNIFNCRVNKLNSVLTSMCTAKFNELVPVFVPKNYGNLAYFDCRAFNVPSLTEAANVLVWRELDASRNSIQMLAQHYFSQKDLDKVPCDRIKEMLLSKYSVDWEKSPSRFKYGAYFRRETKQVKFSSEELTLLPERHDAKTNPDFVYSRNFTIRLDFPSILSIINRSDVIFNDAEPVYANVN